MTAAEKLLKSECAFPSLSFSKPKSMPVRERITEGWLEQEKFFLFPTFSDFRPLYGWLSTRRRLPICFTFPQASRTRLIDFAEIGVSKYAYRSLACVNASTLAGPARSTF